MSDIPLKRCSKCGTEYPETPEYFHRDAKSKTGLSYRCKKCVKKAGAEWYAANREHVRERGRRYYQANRERILERDRAYYYAHPGQWIERNRRYAAANPEKVKLWKAKYRETHREELRQKGRDYVRATREQREIARKKWRQNNPEQARAEIIRYRARKRQAPGTHTGEDIRAQYQAQRGRCWWCGNLLNGTYHVDHLIPLSRGGSNAPENIVLACPSCNMSKNNKLPHEWIGRLF